MIERIASLIEKATAEPWGPGVHAYDGTRVVLSGVQRTLAKIEKTSHEDQQHADAFLIAHARQLLPLMYEVVFAASFYRASRRDPAYRRERLERAFRRLEDYCAQHLPEGEECP